MDAFAVDVIASVVGSAVFNIITELHRMQHRDSSGSVITESSLQETFSSELMRAARSLEIDSTLADRMKKGIAESDQLQNFIYISFRSYATSPKRSDCFRELALSELSDIVGRYTTDIGEINDVFSEYYDVAFRFFRKQEYAKLVAEEHQKIIAILNDIKLRQDLCDHRSLIPYAFIGIWHNSNKPEASLFLRYFQIDDPLELPVLFQGLEKKLFYLVADEWSILGREHVLSMLKNMITPKQLQLYERMILDVLGATDPQYCGTEDERKAARFPVRNETITASTRAALAEGLLLLCTEGQDSSFCLAGKYANWNCFTDSLVAQLLRDVRWESWASLGSVLPVLAEIAPDVFVDSLRKSIEKGANGAISILDQENELFGSSNHTYLIWSLELLLWQRDSFLSTVRLIADIAKLLRNDKRKSDIQSMLHNCLRAYHAQTIASNEQKKKACNILIKSNQELAAALFVSLLPSRGTCLLGTNFMPKSLEGFEYSRRSSISSYDFWEQARFFIECLGKIGTTYSVSLMIPKLPNLIIDDLRDIALAMIAGVDAEEDIASGSIVREALRKSINWQYRLGKKRDREFSDEVLDFLHEQWERLSPQDIAEKHKWLFCYHPDPPYETEAIVSGEDPRVLEDRKATLLTVFEQTDWFDALLKLIDVSDQPHVISETMSTMDVSRFSDTLYTMPLNSNPKRDLFYVSFIGKCILTQKEQSVVVDEAVGQFGIDGDVRRLALQLLAIEPTIALWERVDQLDESIISEYWKRYNVFRLDLEDERLCQALSKLLWVERASAMVELLWHSLHYSKVLELPSGLEEILETLLSLLEKPDVCQQLIPSSYEICGALESLHTRRLDEELLFKLEMKLYPYLVRHTYEFPAISNLLESKPSEFVTLVTWCYKSDLDTGSDHDDQPEKHKTLFAFNFFREWRGIPGYTDGVLDEGILRDWISRVVTESSEAGRGEIVLYEIARILRRVHVEDGNSTLHQSAMMIIEEIGSAKLNEAVMIEIMNSRGVWTKDVGEGGDQERELAQGFLKEGSALEEEYPQVSSILKRLSKKYEEDALKADQEAEAWHKQED